ncbi:hypothetical protein MN116_003130 [Schistosoma mekongi]|uniref:EH domain-containing protein n=1 Tax=Schistosoma mekongi TaxID=38744 RepID=A0AAE1ZH01_SCHME|nr:hypothetical protein MN116_003130 [Schistosoma mekongi]
MISKSNVSTARSCAPSLEEQRRRFESTQLKLQMLSRKSEEIHIDDYIKKLALDHSFVANKDGNKSSSSNAKMISYKASAACAPTYSLPTCSGNTSGVFSSEPVCANPSHLLDLPEVGYLNTSNLFFQSSSLMKPSWLTNLSSLPPIYADAIRAATTTHGLDSSIIYEIFRSSNLSKETLYHIWSLTSCTQPGWFTPTELVTALALIGLAQRKQWEFPSRSPSEAITVESLYEQLCAPVPMLQIPGSDRQTNSISAISGLGSFSQEIVVSTLHDPLNPTTSKFLFQPPIVAFSTFSKQFDTDTISSHQPSQLSSSSNGLNNSVSKTLDSPMHFISSATSSLNDPEWSDFTSFDTSVKRQEQNSNDTLKSHTEVGFSAQKSSLMSTSNTLFDEEFGDFQTSLNTVSSKPIKIINEFSHSNASTADNTAPKSPLQKYTFNIHNPIDSQNKLNSPESLEEQWFRCLTCSLKVFGDSLLVLSSLKNMKDQLEFAESTEGSNFLLDATEIYLMTRRINISSRKYNVLTLSMQELFSDIENSFHKLSLYAVVNDLKNKVDQALKSTLPSEGECIVQDFVNPTLFSYCGVCLSSINLISDQCINSHSNESSDSSQQHQTNHHLVHINLAGRYYHISCANFWMNRVDPCLPAFEIPS